MWRRKIGVMDTAYFLVRYGVIFQLAIVAYLLYWPHSFESCKRIFRIEFVVSHYSHQLVHSSEPAVSTRRLCTLWVRSS